MAQHELMADDKTATDILKNMERRYSFLYSTDRYNGQDGNSLDLNVCLRFLIWQKRRRLSRHVKKV